MMDHPVDQLETFFEEIIHKMDRQFTSHEFLLRLAHEHQHEYVAGLNYYNRHEQSKPFKDLHHDIINRLKKLDGNGLKLKRTDYPSRDLFGIASSAGLWQKQE